MSAEDEPQFVPPALGELRHWAAKMGWESDETFFETSYRFRAWRLEGERLHLIWRERYFVPVESWLETPQADPRLAVPDPAAAICALRVHEQTFDFSAMDDGQVLDHLYTKKITWLNSYTDQTEQAVVPASRSTRLSVSRMGRRFLTFADTAFRSVALDAITDIK
jgi:hypothetical protein